MSAIFYTSVKDKFLKKRLLFGLIPALMGGSLLLLSPLFLDKVTFTEWGWLIFIGGFSALSLGLWPYKRLQKELSHPATINITEDEHLVIGNKKIPFNAIERLYYKESFFSYGIEIRLLAEPALIDKINYFFADFSQNFENVCIHTVKEFCKEDAKKSNFNDRMGFCKQSINLKNRKRIYLPFFSERTARQLSDYISMLEVD